MKCVRSKDRFLLPAKPELYFDTPLDVESSKGSIEISQISKFSVKGTVQTLGYAQNFDHPLPYVTVLTIFNTIRMGLSHFAYPLPPWKHYVTFE